MVANTFDSTALGGRGGIHEFEASLVYVASDRTVKATQRNPDLKNKQTTSTKKNKTKKIFSVQYYTPFIAKLTKQWIASIYHTYKIGNIFLFQRRMKDHPETKGTSQNLCVSLFHSSSL